MRKALVVALVAMLAPLALEAGAPPDGGRRDRGRGGRMGRGMPGGFVGRMMGGREGTDVFDVARRYFELNEEQQAGVRKLDAQHDADEREALAALAKKLNTKYAALIAELLPQEEKAKYQQAIAAMMARDEAIAAAAMELHAVLDKLRADQGVERRGPSDRVPDTKMELITTCFKLAEEQRGALGEATREQRGGMRERMRERMQEIGRPDNMRDPAARRQLFQVMMKMREQADNKLAKDIAEDVLDEKQRAAFQTAAAALDAYKKAAKEARDACTKKLGELLGLDKVPEARQPQPAAKKEAPAKPEKKTEF